MCTQANLLQEINLLTVCLPSSPFAICANLGTPALQLACVQNGGGSSFQPCTNLKVVVNIADCAIVAGTNAIPANLQVCIASPLSLQCTTALASVARRRHR